MKVSKKQSVAHHIGKGLAFVQHVIDLGMDWGFKKLKTVNFASEGDDQAARSTRMKRTAGVVVRFFGDLGDSFYTEYENFKKKRKTGKRATRR